MGFDHLPSDLARALALGGARLGPLAHHVSWFAEVPSTSDEALARAEAGAPEGTVVVADAQTRGRGRLGRTWASPSGAGVYASIVLRPATHSPLLTLAAGVAVADGVEAATGLTAWLKWPNDVCLPGPGGPGRKLGGILTEGGTTAGGALYAVVGLGINVRGAAYPPEVAARATAIEEELGRAVDRDLVLVETLAALWRRYGELRFGAAPVVLDAWRARARETFGRRVEWGTPGQGGHGVTEGIDETGALLVRTSSGVVPITSGEVRWMA